MGGDKIGFFVNPGQKAHFTQLGGQGISVVSYSDKQDEALEYIKWFAQPDVQKKWWALGGYSCSKAVLQRPGFPSTAPFAADFLKSMAIVKDFWAEPAYAELLLGDAEAGARLRRRRPGHGQGGARPAGQGLDRGLPGRRASSSRVLPRILPGRTPHGRGGAILPNAPSGIRVG